MPDSIDLYVLELRQQLSAFGFKADRINEISREAESHLRERVAELMVGKGLTEEEASKMAIAAYGPTEKIAASYYAESDPRILGIRPLWFVLIGTALTICSWDFQWLTLSGYWDIFGDLRLNQETGLIGLLGLATFCLGCIVIRRSMRLPILGLTAAIVAVLPFLFSFWMVGSTKDQQGVSRFHLARDERHVMQDLESLQAFKGYLESGMRIFGSAKSRADVPLDFRNYPAAVSKWGIRDAALAGYQLFGNPLLDGDHPTGVMVGEVYPKSKPADRFIAPRECGVFAFVDGRVYVADESPNLEIARNQWVKLGPSTLRDVMGAEQDMRSLLGNVDDARQGRIFFFEPKKYMDPICWTISLLPMLLLIDWGIWALNRRRQTGQRPVMA